MKRVVLDDHLLRDLLADSANATLSKLVATHEPCTTNLYVLRLCKSIVSARGGQLTGHWTQAQRVALGERLLSLNGIEIAPLTTVAFRMAQIADMHRLSTLGAEAIAAAEHLHATLAVWKGDDGIHIRKAAKALKVQYRTFATG